MDAALTKRALGFGLAVGLVLAAANVYAGLKLAFVDAGTNVVVLLAFAMFGAGHRRFSAGETAVAAAAGSSAGAMALTAGLVGPVPALAMSGHDVPAAVVLVWALGLGVLGTLLAIPFRESLIVVKQLAFPSARAAGVVIETLFVKGERARDTLRWLLVAGVLAAALTVARDELHVVPGGWMVPVMIAGIPAAQLSIGVAASPLLVGVGLLVGLRTALSMLAAAVIAWVVIGPSLVSSGIAKPSYSSIVSWTLWPGAALMVTSSLTSLVLGGGDLWRAVRGELRAGAALRRVQIAVVVLAIGLVVIGWQGFGVHPGFAALAVVLAALFSVAAMYATGETDNTPSGPLGGLTQVIVGPIGPGGVLTPLHAGGVVNGVATHAATMLNGWKTGQHVGTAPKPLLVAQLAGVAVGAGASIAAYVLIREAYGLGTASMPVPGVLSWKATADAVSSGASSMPAGAPLAALVGAITGVALTLLARWRRVRNVVPSAVALGIGFILPASLTAALAVGAIIMAIVGARAPSWQERNAPALASGLIVGEAFCGVVLAALVVIRGLRS